jgi:hypothetical protein
MAKMLSEEEVVKQYPCLGIYSGEESMITGEVFTKFCEWITKEKGKLNKIHVFPAYYESIFFEKGQRERFFRKLSTFRFSRKIVVFPLVLEGHNVVILVHRTDKYIVLYDSIKDSKFKVNAFFYVLSILFAISYSEGKEFEPEEYKWEMGYCPFYQKGNIECGLFEL